MHDFVPWTWPVHTSRRTNHATEQFRVCNIKCGQVLLANCPVARSEARHRGHDCRKKCNAIFDRNLVVRKAGPICMSTLRFPSWAAWNMHPNNLCAHWPSSIWTVAPLHVCKELPDWACVVKIFIFDVFIFKPTGPRDVTNPSNTYSIPSRDDANTRTPFANVRPRRTCMPSCRFNPFVSNFARNADIATPTTAQNTVGLSTHPCRTLAWMLNSRLSTEFVGLSFAVFPGFQCPVIILATFSDRCM